MIVDKIDIESVSILEAENQTPIAGYRDAPEAVKIAFQGMEPPTGIRFHFFNVRSRIERRQHAPELWDLVHGQTTPLVGLKQAAESLMTYG
jgi:hypothetical protein